MTDCKTSQPVYAGVGAASIILVFFVLCLTSFGILSLISAQNNEVSTDKNVSFICDYYNAAALANEFMADRKSKKELGSFNNTFSINDELSLEISFSISEDGNIQISRFYTTNNDEIEDFFDFDLRNIDDY